MKAKTEDTQSRAGSLRRAMMEAGACLAGFADLSCLSSEATKGYPIGIGFALEYDLDAVDGLPHKEPFLSMKADVEDKVKEIYAIAAGILDSWGYGYSRTSSGVPTGEPPFPPEPLPQKTVATLAGLGWVGKSSLLVAPDYGPRVRLGAMLTDGSFLTDKPVMYSGCGDCKLCVEACPAGAIKGANWSPGIDRSDLIDVRLCYECGLCLKACPIGRQ
jgi:epoxyqueuosine reductase